MHTCSPSLGVCPHCAHQAHGEHTPCGKWCQSPPHPKTWAWAEQGPSHQAVPAQCCCAGSCAVGEPWGQLWAAPRPGSPSALCRGPHHGHKTQATITNPTNFSPNLSQRQIAPVPGGFDHHGLMGSHREAHKKRHRLKTGTLWTVTRAWHPTMLHSCQTREPAANRKMAPKTAVARSCDLTTCHLSRQRGLCRRR